MSARARDIAVPVAIALAIVVALLGVRRLGTTDPLGNLRCGHESTPCPPRGFVYLPRGGPYRFALEATGPARAEVDGQPISTDPMRPTRLVLQPGQAPIVVDAPPGSRLLWHPPGRVSDVTLEYVPASALASAGPFRGGWDSWAGTSPFDAAIAAAIALTLIALLLVLARHRLRAAGRDVVLATVAVLIVAAVARLVDVGGAGQTWDEDVNWSAGRNYVENLLALDVAPRSWVWNYEHPPVSKYLAGIGALWEDGYDAARSVMALVMALGCALLVPIGARLYSLRVGLLAGGIAALSPHLVAHGKVVGHEAPSVLWWMLALLLCLGVHDGPVPDDARAATRRLVARLSLVGVALGLAVATRFVNALLAVPVGITLLVLAPPEARRRTVGWGLAILPAVAVATLFVVWPRLWATPFEHLAEAWARLRRPHALEPYLGAITNQPPLSYFAVYLFATAPVGVLALALGGLARAGRASARWRDPALARERRAALLVLVWLLAPLGVMASPVRQDGVRYVMPSLAILALLAAAGTDALLALALRRSRIAAVGVVAALAVYLAVVCVRIHPYYLDYYGEHVGGPEGVARARRFETAWWGEGLADAVDHVNRHAAPGARVHRDCVQPAHLAWFRGDLWTPMVRDPRQADWIVVYQPWTHACPVPPDSRLVHRVTAMGAPLVEVYQRNPLAAPAAPRQLGTP